MDWSVYRNFRKDEFTCKCGCGRADMQPSFMGRLQALRMVYVIEAEASLDAKALRVGRTITTLDMRDALVAYMEAQLAADAAIRADRIDAAIRRGERRIARRHQCAGWASLHTFAAGHATGYAKRIILIEHDARMLAAQRHANHIVALLVTTGTQASGALDAGVELHRDRRV